MTTYGRGEGLRGAQHIAHRLAMANGGRAICGARVLWVNLDTISPAKCNVRDVTCAKCEREAWAGHDNEERLAGAYA